MGHGHSFFGSGAAKKLAKKSPGLLTHPGLWRMLCAFEMRSAHGRPRMGATVDSSGQVMAPWIAQRLRLAALAAANT
jgi:hypothetical protein